MTKQIAIKHLPEILFKALDETFDQVHGIYLDRGTSLFETLETISAEEARQDQWEPQVAAIGTLNAVNGIEMAPQVGGVVKELLFDSGDLVKKGQKLIQLDTDTEQADLKNFRVQLGNAQIERAARGLGHVFRDF